MKKILILLLLSCNLLANTLVLERITEGDLKAEEIVFMASFAQAYKDIPLEVLKVNDLNSFLKAAFEDEPLDLNNPSKKVYCISAKQDTTVIGFITFENTEKTNEVYVRQMAVAPAMWGKHIGTMLLDSIKQQLPDTQRIVLVTRKVNSVARGFYEKLGFKTSDYVHGGLSPERYIGYELSVI